MRVPEDLEREIEREMRLRGTTFADAAVSLLREAVRMRRVPGILFVDGADGRRAAVAGTGPEVWEVVRTWRELKEDFRSLAAFYDWLSERQLRAALDYYERYPEEIEHRLAREERWTPERVQQEMPWASPRANDL